MKSSKLVLTLSVIIAIASLLVLVVTMNKFGITGQAVDTATANLTIATSASISFTDAVCNFGSGSVDEAPDNATIDTETATTTDGSWTGSNCNGLVISNDGNVNVSLTISSGAVVASGFIGGSAVTPSMQWKSTTSSCDGANALSSYVEIDGNNQNACDDWAAAATTTIDFFLVIPEDAVGTSGMVITATGTA